MKQKYLIGTLFDEEELNKKMNANNVKLKDPMGNVRWKGAFTGGFQAGFKNTCGSREGWTPASFVSTIDHRSQKKEQNIFDFMDKQDLGRQAIGANIQMQQGFTRKDNNPININQVESIGQKILNDMKKKAAFMKAPQNVAELQKLLESYESKQILEQHQSIPSLKGVQGYASVGATDILPDDDFVIAYEDLFRKVIRAGAKQETEQQIAKRRQQNKVYFDFKKPLEQEPEYLKQIQEIQEMAKPKKRRKNAINDKRLKDLFKLSTAYLTLSLSNAKLEDNVPVGYDMYHRIKTMKDKDKQFAESATKKHRILSLEQRSEALQQNKLSSRFIAVGAVIKSNKFVKSSQDQSAKGLQKMFEDVPKNKRYWDYVFQIEGKKISAQLECMSYEEAQKQKEQFEKLYNLRSSEKIVKLPNKVEEALKAKNRKQLKTVRKTGSWKPEKLLCKKFGCVLPYKEERTNAESTNYF